MKEFLFQVQAVLLPVFLAFCTFISPIAGVLLAVGAAIATDTIFARYRVYVQNKRNKAKLELGEIISEDDINKGKWRSRKFRAGLIPKVITYNCFVLTFFVIDTFVINDFISLFSTIQFAPTKILAMVLIYTESLSISESFEAIKGKSLFKYLIEMIVHAKKLNKQMSDINEAKEKAPEK
jgi:hypothetical protein